MGCCVGSEAGGSASVSEGQRSPPPATPRFSVFSLSPMFCGVRCVLERGQVAFMATKRWNSWGFERPPTGLDARRFPHAWFALGWWLPARRVVGLGCRFPLLQYASLLYKSQVRIRICGTRRRRKRINAIAYESGPGLFVDIIWTRGKPPFRPRCNGRKESGKGATNEKDPQHGGRARKCGVVRAALPIDTVTWFATGGTISSEGVYTAGEVEGLHTVRAKVSGLEALSQVAIKVKEEPPPSPPPPGKRTIRWRGAVPPQKWMNFYTKVLTRFAGSPELKLEVSFEVSVDSDQWQSKADHTRTGLKELGLDDNVPLN